MAKDIKVNEISSTTAVATWSLYTSPPCADKFVDRFQGFRIKINNEDFFDIGYPLSFTYKHNIKNMESCAVQEISILPLFSELGNTYPGIETSEK